ncbi:MAG TPA: hypothetical protein VHC48_19145 [Puia sp.]|nr:hypothetical protein [Puia sp.]
MIGTIVKKILKTRCCPQLIADITPPHEQGKCFSVPSMNARYNVNNTIKASDTKRPVLLVRFASKSPAAASSATGTAHDTNVALYFIHGNLVNCA